LALATKKQDWYQKVAMKVDYCKKICK